MNRASQVHLIVDEPDGSSTRISSEGTDPLGLHLAKVLTRGLAAYTTEIRTDFADARDIIGKLADLVHIPTSEPLVTTPESAKDVVEGMKVALEYDGSASVIVRINGELKACRVLDVTTLGLTESRMGWRYGKGDVRDRPAVIVTEQTALRHWVSWHGWDTKLNMTDQHIADILLAKLNAMREVRNENADADEECTHPAGTVKGNCPSCGQVELDESANVYQPTDLREPVDFSADDERKAHAARKGGKRDPDSQITIL